MSGFLSEKYQSLTPYTPGEQPRDRKYIKLNTNESPFPPSPFAERFAREAAGDLNLYSDPTAKRLTEAIAERYDVDPAFVITSNGSDELLNFAFMAFADDAHPAAFPDITYGFYPVFAELNRIPYEEIPLKEDFTINVNDYRGIRKTVFIANPNAPTGIALPLSDIEAILKSDPENVLVLDEAYVDFGAESAIPLTKTYKNLLVIQTFSKSRSLAGARLGFAVGDPALIADLNLIKYSTNPYNVNRMTQAAGIGALLDETYFKKNCSAIAENRAMTAAALEKLGFKVLPSAANFIFARSEKIDGGDLYRILKERGILVRHFTKPRLSPFIRVSIGSRAEMEAFIAAVREIVGE